MSRECETPEKLCFRGRLQINKEVFLMYDRFQCWQSRFSGFCVRTGSVLSDTPSRRTIFCDLLSAAYNVCISKVQAFMETVDAVTLTTDSGTSATTVATAHYLELWLHTQVMCAGMCQIQWATHRRQPCQWTTSRDAWMESVEQSCCGGNR